jgi:hypothetical protein
MVVYALPPSTASQSLFAGMLPGHPLLSADRMRFLKGEALNQQILERQVSNITHGGLHAPTPEPLSPQSPQSLETPSGISSKDKDLHGALLRQSSSDFTNRAHAAHSRAPHTWGGLADLKGVVRILNSRILKSIHDRDVFLKVFMIVVLYCRDTRVLTFKNVNRGEGHMHVILGGGYMRIVKILGF